MNCPQCAEIGQGMRLAVHQDATRTKMRCDACGWSSDCVEDLVAASPRYREAELGRKVADGKAKPGWYGPDGEKAIEHSEAYMEYCIIWHGHYITKTNARLCGFVEVK